LLPPLLTTTTDGSGGNGDNYGYDRPFAWGSLQPPPLGGAVGHDVRLTVAGNGVVGLGVGLLVVGLLVNGAIGRDVGLMVVGNGVVGLGIGLLVGRSLDVGEYFFYKCCRLMLSIILPASSRSHLHRHLPPARATALPSGAANGHRCRQHCRQRQQQQRQSVLRPLPPLPRSRPPLCQFPHGVIWRNSSIVALSLLCPYPCGTGHPSIPVALPLHCHCWRRQQCKSGCVAVALP
jgi:hypothetical protein